jgi:hypothetical protein
MFILNEKLNKVEISKDEKERLENILRRCYRDALTIDDGLSDVLEMGGMKYAVETLLHTVMKTANWYLDDYGFIVIEKVDNVPWNNVCEDINRRFGTNYGSVDIPDVNQL